MNKKWFYLIFFSSVNIYAKIPSAHPDHATWDVFALVDKHIVVDDDGNQQTVIPAQKPGGVMRSAELNGYTQTLTSLRN